ncbi:MAG: hypothetical protein AAF492_08260, partial [Verrucomicrobiota bacterium]
LPLAGLTTTSATLRALLSAEGSAFSVTAYWGTVDGGTSPGSWANSASLGSFTDVNATNLAAPVGGLFSNTTYVYTFHAVNEATSIWLQPSLPFTTLGAAPRVDNGFGAVSGVGMADLPGRLLDGVAADVTVYWGLSDGGTTPAAWDQTVPLGTLSTGPFQIQAANLLFGETYYYRTYATNAFGEDWADVTTNFFPLRPPGSGVNNLAASSVTETSAMLNAAFTSEDAIYAVTLYHGPSDGDTNAGAWANSVPLGTFTNQSLTNLTFTVSGLSPASFYYYGWRVTNPLADTWGGPSIVFETLGVPRVDNGIGATMISSNGATLNGSFTSPDRGSVIFYYGTNNGGTVAGAWHDSVSLGPIASATFSTAVTGLMEGVEYYYRTYATNAITDSWASVSATFLTIGATALNWRIPPAADAYNSITMTAEYIFDPAQVQYFFSNTVNGNVSGWQSSPIWTDTNLGEGQTYSYRVRARDNPVDQNLTAWSPIRSATTIPGLVFCENFEVPDLMSGITPGERLGFEGPGFWDIDAPDWQTFNHPSYTGICDEESNLFTTPNGSQATRAGKELGNGSLQTTPIMLGEVLTPATTYTLTFDVAKKIGSANGTYWVELKAGATVLASAIGPVTLSDFSENIEVVYTSPPSHPALGETLAIRIWNGGPWPTEPLYDNVKLKIGGALGLIKTAPPTLDMDQGMTNLSYKLTVLNTHTTDLGGIVVSDVLPDELAFVSSVPAPSQTGGNTLSFDVGILNPGSNAVITIDTVVTGAVPSSVTVINLANALTTNRNIFPTTGCTRLRRGHASRYRTPPCPSMLAHGTGSTPPRLDSPHRWSPGR